MITIKVGVFYTYLHHRLLGNLASCQDFPKTHGTMESWMRKLKKTSEKRMAKIDDIIGELEEERTKLAIIVADIDKQIGI